MIRIHDVLCDLSTVLYQLAESVNTIILLACLPKILHKHCFLLFFLELAVTPEEKTETTHIRNLGGQTKSIMVFSASAN